MSPDQQHEKPPIALTIAGFDPSSGAGATADLQVFAAHGLFGTSCLTALTVQSTVGVKDVRPVEPRLLAAMLACLVEDLSPDGVKIGMLGSLATVEVVSSFLATLPPGVPVLLDPVLRSSSGHDLLEPAAIGRVRENLFGAVTCITPNRQELALLVGRPLPTEDAIFEAAAQLLAETKLSTVVVTGGEAAAPDDLILSRDTPAKWLRGSRVETSSTHGTGCAFSSALLSGMVLGADIVSAAVAAKSYVEEGLRLAPGLGHGRGPLRLPRDEGWRMSRSDALRRRAKVYVTSPDKQGSRRRPDPCFHFGKT